MRRLCAMLAVIVLYGCSESYGDLASAFPSGKSSSGPALIADSIDITSQRHPGVTSYRGIVLIRASTSSVYVSFRLPFTMSLSIPQREIAACAMTCFGTSNPNVDLIIPKTGTDLI